MLEFISHLTKSISTKTNNGVEYARDNAWRLKTIPYYLQDNMRATASAGVALTAYAVSNVSEEFDSLNMTANATLYAAATYGVYSLYQSYQHKKAVEQRISGMDLDEGRSDKTYQAYDSDEESYEDEDYSFDSDSDADAELSQSNILSYSRR